MLRPREPNEEAEQGVAPQSATRSEFNSSGSLQPKPRVEAALPVADVWTSTFAKEVLRSTFLGCHIDNMKTTALIIALVCSSFIALASEEEFLGWTSAVIQCAGTQESGDVSCDIKVGDGGWEKFVIQAFGTTHTLTKPDLVKLKDFPLSSLSTRHEVGYERLGGYTVHFRFSRTFYNRDKKLITETVYVSTTKEGFTVSPPRTTGN